MLTLGCRAVPGGSFEVARRIIPRLGLAVTLLGLTVANVGRTVAVASFDVALACACEGVLAFVRDSAVLLWSCQTAVHSFVHIFRVTTRHSLECAGRVQRRLIAITIAATFFRSSGEPPRC